MDTMRLIKQHYKCLRILELIEIVNNRLWQAGSKLNLYQNTVDWKHPVKLMNTERDLIENLAYNRKLKKRLIGYYLETNNAIPK